MDAVWDPMYVPCSYEQNRNIRAILHISRLIAAAVSRAALSSTLDDDYRFPSDYVSDRGLDRQERELHRDSCIVIVRPSPSPSGKLDRLDTPAQGNSDTNERLCYYGGSGRTGNRSLSSPQASDNVAKLSCRRSISILPN